MSEQEDHGKKDKTVSVTVRATNGATWDTEFKANTKGSKVIREALVASLAPTEIRGSAFGVLAGIQSLGNVAASGVAGLLWTLVSPRVAFLYVTAWMVVALLGLVALGRHR